MKRLLWVRLAFRAMGVLLIGLAIPSCLYFAGELISLLGVLVLQGTPVRPWGSYGYVVGMGLGGALQLSVGLYLFSGGKSVRAWCMRDVDSHCPRCDYEYGAAMTVCPECGLKLIDDFVTAMPPAASNGGQSMPPK